MLHQKIGFIGAGMMGGALLRGILTAKVSSPEKTLASDAIVEILQQLEKETGIKTTQDNSEAARQSDIVILAVKPNIMPEVLSNIKGCVNNESLVVSIAAGITVAALESELSEARVVRVMPNLPCVVGEMAAGFALGKNATAEDGEIVKTILDAVGKSFIVEEKLLDAVTGLSGSGPAYVYMVIEALASGGLKMGLPRDVSLALSAQTVLGAAKMVLESGQHPAQLKDAVTSPGGTTIAGIHALEKGGLRAALMDAVEAATLRAAELGSA